MNGTVPVSALAFEALWIQRFPAKVKTGLYLMSKNTASPLLALQCHRELLCMFDFVRRKAQFDPWNLLILEAMLYLFIIQTTFLGCSVVMNMHVIGWQLKPLVSEAELFHI